jgi:uncharacterized protein (DUF362 family)
MRSERVEGIKELNSSRRDFIKKIGTAAAGLMVAPYLKPSGVLAYDHKQVSAIRTTVAVCNTANTPADSYMYDDAGGGVRQKVKYVLDLLDQNMSGQVKALFSKGKKVAIKINMVGGSGNSSSPKLGQYKITEAMWTHPAVLQAVGQYIIDAGVNPTDIYIVDAFWDTNWQTAGATVPFASNDKFGYKAAMNALGCNVVDLNDTTAANTMSVSTGSNHFNFASFTLNKVLQNIDVYVSIPKLKHHSAAGLSCSLKNQIGIAPISLYTVANDNGRRGALHHPTSSAAEWTYLPETICDLNAARPVHLAIVDGIKNSTGGEGAWCATFAPCSKHVLLAGIDPVATDSIGATIMGLDPAAKSLPLQAPLTVGGATSSTTDNYLYLLNAKGIGTNQLSEIRLVGDGTGLVTSVAENSGPSQPREFQLCSNFPNPFNPSTMIVFFLPRTERVTLRVYDITGRTIETLIDGEVPAGEHRMQWSAQGLASGVYFCRMEAAHFADTIKLIYQK